jgi:hypothetical protein
MNAKTQVVQLSRRNKKVKFQSPRFPRPGVIRAIVGILEKAGSRDETMSVEDIAEKLTKQFPERDPGAMVTTIRAQLSRLPTERGVDIVKKRDGRTMRYAARIA